MYYKFQACVSKFMEARITFEWVGVKNKSDPKLTGWAQIEEMEMKTPVL